MSKNGTRAPCAASTRFYLQGYAFDTIFYAKLSCGNDGTCAIKDLTQENGGFPAMFLRSSRRLLPKPSKHPGNQHATDFFNKLLAPCAAFTGFYLQGYAFDTIFYAKLSCGKDGTCAIKDLTQENGGFPALFLRGSRRLLPRAEPECRTPDPYTGAHTACSTSRAGQEALDGCRAPSTGLCA